MVDHPIYIQQLRYIGRISCLDPIFKNDAEKAKVLEEAGKVVAELKSQGLAVKLDDRDGIMPGAKYYEWEAKGVPLRIEDRGGH